MHAKNLSFVKGCNVSKKSIKIDSVNVPTIDLKKKLFPILKIAKMNNGTLIPIIIIPIGKCNK